MMRNRLIAVIGLLISLAPTVHSQGTISTVAGGVPNNVPAVTVGLDPTGVFEDSGGNFYISSVYTSSVYKVSASGQLTTVAGNGTYGFSGDGGPATNAQLSYPQGLYVDAAGDIFISDTFNYRVREVVASTGDIQTVAGNGTSAFNGDGGLATNAELGYPQGLFVDTAGDIFIADTENSRIREVVASTGDIKTVAGGGTAGLGDGGLATNAELNSPAGVFVDNTTGDIFIADTFNDRVREVVASTGDITTIAGNGTAGFSGDGGLATSAELSDPEGVFVDTSGDIFIADSGNNRIREVVASTGDVTTVAGNGSAGFSGDGGLATSAALALPEGVVVDKTTGDIFIVDFDNNRIREVVASTGDIQTVAGNGTLGFSGDGGLATSAQLFDPDGVFLDSAGDIFIADTENSRIREVVASTGDIKTVAGNGTAGFNGDGGLATSAELNFPQGVFVDTSGDIFIADTDNSRIREVIASTGDIQTVAGNGTAGFSEDGVLATSAELNVPQGVFVDNTTGNIFIADTANSRIREVVASTGDIQTVAGNGTAGFSGDGGLATSAELSFPQGLALDTAGDIFIADSNNARVREVVASTGDIQTIAGTAGVGFNGDGELATSAELSYPTGVYVDTARNIFIADFDNARIREIVAATGDIQTVAGNGTYGFSGDGGLATSAELSFPTGVWGNSAGNLVLADPDNDRIRGFSLAATPATAASTTTLTSSVNPSAAGQSVTFTATISPASGGGTPTGNVTFRDSVVEIGAGAINTGTGQATFSTSSLNVGTHTIRAVYAGDSNFSGSTSSPVTQVVSPPTVTSCTTNCTISGTVTGPWIYGVTITAVLTGGGSASTTTDPGGNYSLTGLAAGTYTVTPSLLGYNFSPAAPSITISSSPTTQNFAVTSAVVSFNISGTLTYSGAQAGNTIIRVFPTGCTGCSVVAGYSISSAPPSTGTAYTLKGLAPGSYIVNAQIDTQGTGISNESDPQGNSATVTISTANLTGVNFTLTDQTPSEPVTPSQFTVAATNNGAVIQYKAPLDDNGEEIATYYDVYYGTDVDASNGAGSPKTFKAQGKNTSVFILTGLANGLTYFKLSAVNSAGESAPTAPVSATLGTTTGLNTVSGTVTFPGTATGPLYVGVYSNSGAGIYSTAIADPVSPQAYSVSGIPSGSYQNFAIIDMNNDGEVDAGDLDNVSGNSNPPTITVSGGGTTAAGTLALSDPTATTAVTTNTQQSSGSSTIGYNLNLGINFGSKLPVSMILFSGMNVGVPYYMNADENNASYSPIYINSVSPSVGDTYQFLVTFSDGTTQVLPASVTAVLTSFAQNLAMNTPVAGSATIPVLNWSAPSSPPAFYTYSVGLNGTTGTENWYYQGGQNGNGNGIPSSQTSVLFNVDGSANPNSSLTPGATYNWSVQVQDANYNSATFSTSYTVPATGGIAPPTISKAFGAGAIAVNGTTSLTFTITNPNSSNSLSGVGFTDTLTGGLVVATPNALTNTCNGTPTATAGSASVSLSAGTLVAGGSCIFSVNVNAPTAGTISNTTGDVTSTEGGTGTTSNTASLTVGAPPTISSLSPNSGPVGTTITITGTNFGTSQGSSTISFNGTITGTAASWSATSIMVNVPSGATTGNVVVTVLGVASATSASTLFTVTTTSSLPASCAGAPPGQESVLSGRWVVLSQGWTGTSPGYPSAAVFNFSANGAGSFVDVSGTGSGITGNYDANLGANGAGSVFSLNVLTAGSSYNVGLDPTNGTGYVGCMTLALSNGATVVHRFTLSVTGGSAVEGRIIDWEDTSGTGSGTRASGLMLPQDPSAFAGGTLANLKSNYAFGEDGADPTTDPTGGHFAEAGTVSLNTATGAFSGVYDVDDAGTLGADLTISGTFAAPSPTTGRLLITSSAEGSTSPAHTAMYIVNANEVFVVGIDPYSSNPIYSGRAIATGTSFSNSSLSGNYVMPFTGRLPADTEFCTLSVPCANVTLGVLGLSGGTINSSIFYVYYGQGNAVATSSPIGTYSVVPSGRTLLTYSGAPVMYLTTPQTNPALPAQTEPIVAFMVGTDLSASFGAMESGANSNVSVSAMAGNYIGGIVDPGDSTVQNSTIVANSNSSGTITGYQYKSDLTGLSDGGLASGGGGSPVLNITNSPLPGFGTIDIGTIAVTNGTRIWFIDTGSSDESEPRINIIEPAAATGASAPAITSANSATFTVGVSGSFTVTTTGSPTPALSETGSLPSSVTFADNGNGTATITGIPATGTASSYPITITANNGITPNAVQAFTLNVVTAPLITSFSPAATTITAGGSTTLTAVFSGGTGSINNGVGPVSSGTPVTISPSATTTYTLTVTNAAGASVTQTTNVTLVPAPAITSFTPGAATITAGGSTTLTAVFSGGTGSVNNGVGAISSGTPVTISPSATTTYTLTVTNTATTPATVTATTTVTVSLAPPTIVSLSTHSGTVGTLITTTGTNFGASQGSSTVTVNGVAATATSWSATSITVTVPSAATGTGNVVVTVSGVASATSASTAFTVTTSSLAASCAGAPSGQESVLSGRWVALSQGWEATNPGSPVAFLFGFDASGTGSFVDVSGGSGITGNIDHNLGSGGASSVFSGNVLTAGSSYDVGLDPTNGTGYVGCMTLPFSNGNTVVYRFTLSVTSGSAVSGRIIRWTDTNGTETRTSGVMLPQDATAFSGGTLSNLKPNYAYGEDGTDTSGGHVAEAGNVSLNVATGAFSGTDDVDDAGTLQADQSISGTFSAPSAQTGRTLITGSGSSPTHLAMYIVNANELFVIGIDPYVAGGPGVYSGRAIATGTSFSNTSLSGNYVAEATGSTTGTTSCNGGGPCATAALGVLNFAAGTLTNTIENYTQGTAISTSTGSGTYSVAASGRVPVVGGGGHPPVLYLTTPQSNTEPIAAFVVGTDSPATFGVMEAGANSNVTQSSLAGKYVYGSVDPGDSTVNNSVGVATLDTSGNATGYEFDSNTGGLVAGGGGGTPITISNSPLPGFGSSGSNTFALTNGSRIWLLGTGTEDSSPALIVIIEPAAPATVGAAPAITSANNVTFTVGVNGTFTVTTTGSPTPALTETGSLPSSVTFTDNGNGTATITGIPATGTAASYPISITANNGITPNAVQTFTLTVVLAPVPPTISKAFNPSVVALNHSTTLTFTINNPNASSSLSGVGFSDTFPAGLSVLSPNGLSGSCGSGTITAAPGSSSVNLSGGTLAAGGSCTFSVNVTATVAGTINNTTGNVTSNEGGTGGTSNTASLTVLAPPTIVSLSATSGTVGTPITITGTNFGTTQAQGSSTVTVNGVSVGTVTNSNWSPTSIIVTVPSTATGTGNVVVTVLGVASNGVSFTVESSSGLLPSATALASSLNPSVFGQSVTFAAPVDGSTGGTPTGTVSFYDAGVLLGTGSIVSGQATFSTPSLSVGTHSITAVYGGNASFLASTSNVVAQIVNVIAVSTPSATPTFIAVSSTPNPAAVGATVQFTATVNSGSTSGTPPTGNVTFLNSGVSLGVSPVTSGGVATLSTSALNACANPITAQYSGDANYASSLSVVLIELVGSCTPPVSVQITPNPQNVVSGEVIQFGATVLGATNTAVTWEQLSGPGTLSPTGQYTAPTSSSSTATITIAATSLADSSAATFIQFSLAADALTTNTQAPATITAGSTLSVTINLAGPPSTGTNSNVPFTLSCSNLPVATSCVFTPPTVTGANPQFTVMIVTSGGTSSSHLAPLPLQAGRPWYALIALLLPALAMVGLRRGVFFERKSYACFVLVLLCLATMFLASCTGFSPAPITSVEAPVAHALTPSGAFQLVVTATPGANTGNFVQTQLIVPITVN